MHKYTTGALLRTMWSWPVRLQALSPPGFKPKLKSLGAGFLGGPATIGRRGLRLSASFGCRLGVRLLSSFLEELLVLPARAGWEGFGLVVLCSLLLVILGVHRECGVYVVEALFWDYMESAKFFWFRIYYTTVP